MRPDIGSDHRSRQQFLSPPIRPDPAPPKLNEILARTFTLFRSFSLSPRSAKVKVPGPLHVRSTRLPRLSLQSKLAHSSTYRPEIDGLRALAVLSVLLFHAAVPGFSGGFVGVDIFYVISGFLITSIIAKDVAVGKFSFVSFYDRRIRRIFPALFGVVLFTLLASVLFLAPKDFATFGKNLVAMTFFVSNIFFKREGAVGGYFDDSSNSQVLLHTWSLSVEEQFYLFFPTALILLSRFAKKRSREFLALAVVVSFAINIWATHTHPRSAFYLLIPRAWELLLGSLLALKAVPPLTNRLAREVASLLGLGLIFWAVFVFNPETAFPGYAVLLPCLGVWLIIYASEHGFCFVRSLLSLKPLVAIGVISYSLYLWHWPIIVFSKYLSAGNLSLLTTVLVLLSSLLLAFFSYEFIESPFRGSDSPISRRQVFSFGLAATALSALLGFVIYTTQGVPGRFDSQTLQRIAANLERKTDYQEVCSNWKTRINSLADIGSCSFGSPSSQKIMYWGDSHVQQLYPLVKKIYDSGVLPGRGIVFVISNGCPPVQHLNRPLGEFHCDSFSRYALLRAEQPDVDTVFIAFAAVPSSVFCTSVDDHCLANLSPEESRIRVLQELTANIQELKLHGKRVILSLPFPLFDKSVPDLEIRNAILHRFGFSSVAREISFPAMRQQIISVAQQTGAEIFDPRKSLCSPISGCMSESNGVSIYKDHSHLVASQIGLLQPELESILLQPPPHQLTLSSNYALGTPVPPDR